MRISHFVILVEDIDEALKFYTEKLGFIKQRDDILWINLRWATVSPKNQPDVQLTLALADDKQQNIAVDQQTPNHPLMFLETDDLQRDYIELKARGVNVVTYPEEREWGTEVVFTDLYGNLFVLVQRPQNSTNNQ
jgi:catechol 2,3-dioxygenase-like lactoylglutathione lyase family enzyme